MDQIAKSDQECAIYHIDHSVCKQKGKKKKKNTSDQGGQFV